MRDMLSTHVGVIASPGCPASSYVTGGSCENTDSEWGLFTEKATAAMGGSWECDFVKLFGGQSSGTVTECVISTP